MKCLLAAPISINLSLLFLLYISHATVLAQTLFLEIFEESGRMPVILLIRKVNVWCLDKAMWKILLNGVPKGS